jgi:hypothetical protein
MIRKPVGGNAWTATDRTREEIALGGPRGGDKQGSWAALLASSVAGKWVRVSLVSRLVCDACELVMQGWRWGSIRGLRFVAMAV